MTTRETVTRYFDDLKRRNGWESALSDDMVFMSFTSPTKQVKGKQAYLEATKRFYSMIRDFELRELMIDGERAVALTRYELQPPNGSSVFTSDVAEIYTVHNGKIDSFSIYFDSSPFPKQPN